MDSERATDDAQGLLAVMKENLEAEKKKGKEDGRRRREKEGWGGVKLQVRERACSRRTKF